MQNNSRFHSESVFIIRSRRFWNKALSKTSKYVHSVCFHIWRFLLLNNEVAWVLLTIVVSLSFKPTLSPLFMSVTFDGKISIPSFISWHCYNVIFSIILSAAQSTSWMHNLVFRSSWPSETLLLLYFLFSYKLV